MLTIKFCCTCTSFSVNKKNSRNGVRVHVLNEFSRNEFYFVFSTSLSVVFYGVSMMSQGEVVTLSRETRFEANITVETLEANVAFTRIDGRSKSL